VAEKITEILKQILERLSLTLFGLAVVTIGIAAMGEIPAIGVSIHSSGQMALYVLGAVILVTAVFFALKETQESGRFQYNSKKYGLKVESPLNGSVVNKHFEVKGRVEKNPGDDVQFWLFTVRQAKETPCKPYRPLPINADLTWAVDVTPTNSKPNDVWRLVIFAVGPSGQTMIDYYFKVGDRLSDAGIHDWPGFDELPRDVVRCSDFIRVTLAA
jgi:hypothetical protein